jgi:hypothetical protein
MCIAALIVGSHPSVAPDRGCIGGAPPEAFCGSLTVSLVVPGLGLGVVCHWGANATRVVE